MTVKKTPYEGSRSYLAFVDATTLNIWQESWATNWNVKIGEDTIGAKLKKDHPGMKVMVVCVPPLSLRDKE